MELKTIFETDPNPQNSPFGPPKKSFGTLPRPKNSRLGPKKVKTDHKIKSKSKVRIERNIENERCSTT